MSTTWERIIGNIHTMIEGAKVTTYMGESHTARRQRIIKTATDYLMGLSSEERAYLAKALVEGPTPEPMSLLEP